MALGRYSRVDGKKSSSSYCSTVSLVVFVALCLVGVWMLTSSSVVPVQNVDVSTQEANDEVKERASEIKDNTKNNENTDTNSKRFEDNPGDLPDESTKATNNDTTDTLEKNNENSVVNNQGDIPGKENTEEEKKPEDTPKDEKENGDEELKSKDSETGETTTDGNNKKKEGSEESSNEDKKPDGNNEKKEGSEESSNEDKKPDGNNEKKEGSEESSNEEKNPDGNNEKKEGSKESSNEDKKPDGNNEKKEGSEESLNEDKKPKDNGGENNNEDNKSGNQGKEKTFEAELLKETSTQNGDWKSQASESKNERESSAAEYKWKLCNVTAGPDYIPCLDNLLAIKNLRSTKHYEHRERHCPEDPPTCLVDIPEGYQRSIQWPTSREKIWYRNVPHTELAKVKGHQNWVKVDGNYLTFPGGGTQFKYGALHYIDFIQQSVPDIAWGKRSRVVLDVGCGVASFGGFLFDRDVLTMSFAPKDEHEAQVQFALERGIPGISAVMGTKRLPFPGRVFDIIHCARCRVPWHIEGGKLLLELNRVLRPGAFFVWSATPVYLKGQEDVEIWQEMTKLTKAMCWDLVSKVKDRTNKVGIAIYRKPISNECYEKRSKNEPPVCEVSDDPNAAWNVPLQACMHQIPVDTTERGSQWPEQWPSRLTKAPYWLLSSNKGVYGKPAPEDFTVDYEHWKRVVTNSYLKGMGINWSTVRNVMDMKAIYGGFAAALKDLNIWVMNVVPLDSPDTLPVIYERGLFGIYHDWCESFNTYPRSYDLLHADHLFSKISKKCNILGVVAETDRILRPEGKLIVRDKVETVNELQSLFKAMHWEIKLTYSKDGEGLLLVQKTMWRPTESETITYAIA